MSGVSINPVRQAVAVPPTFARAEQVCRTPLYLESQGEPLFAWLHRPANAGRTTHGIVICPPIGYEQIHCHRALRHFADECARGGFPALRLDYFGTGDSAGTDEDAALCATRQANIHDALMWMRQQLGCVQITLVGLRFGATMAAHVAATDAIDGLLLWAPVVRGRAYVREMRALSLTATGGIPASGDLEAAGFVLTVQTAQDASLMDLLRVQPRCRRALILDRDDAPQEIRLAEHLRKQGIDTGQDMQPGYADMMAEPHDTKVPSAAIRRAVAWLRAGDGATPAVDYGCEHGKNEWPTQAVMAVSQGPGPSTNIRERILHLGPLVELFGIVSEPRDPVPGRPFIVLLNAGSAYRVGPNRLHVGLARQLAVHGFRCLRLDLAGLGDGFVAESAEENKPYPDTAFRDIDLTLKHLRSHLGVQHVVLMGLCSGAYLAFQSAAQFANPMLIESVAINPLTFFWNEGMSLDISPAAQLQTYRAYMAAVFRPGKWLEVLSGRSRIGIMSILRTLVSGWIRRLGWSRKPAAKREPRVADLLPAHRSQDDVPGDLQRIVRAGRHLACFFARSDPGYPLLTQSAGPLVLDLCQSGKMSVQFIDDADHTFSGRSPRRELEQAITEHLLRRYKD